MKWGEVQIICLKKMFLNNEPISIEDLPNLKNDEAYSSYLNSMPEACNEALYRICTKYKYLLKKASIVLKTEGNYNRYNLKELIPDFFKFVSLIREVPEKSEYFKTSNYKFEGENTIIIPNDSEAIYAIEYYAYPEKIDESTSDTYELGVSEEVASLLSIYIASEIYKDDDIALATMYRNQFENGILELNNVDSSEAPQFESTTGWW